MNITVRIQTLFTAVFGFLFFGLVVASCTPNQIQSTQGTLNKVEAATTQAANVATTVSTATTPPVSNYASDVAAILAGALALEKILVYLLPFLTKSVSTSVSASNNQNAKPAA